MIRGEVKFLSSVSTVIDEHKLRTFAGDAADRITVCDWGVSEETKIPAPVFGKYINKTHSGPVTNILLLGDKLISSSWDGKIVVQNAETNEKLLTLKGHTENIKAIAVLSPHVLVSSSADAQIKFWDLATGACLHTVMKSDAVGHTRAVETLAVAGLVSGVGHVSRALFSSGGDRRICLWRLDYDVEDVAGSFKIKLIGKTTRAVDKGIRPVHETTIWKVVLNDLQDTLVSCSGDKTAKLWKVYDLLDKLNSGKDDAAADEFEQVFRVKDKELGSDLTKLNLKMKAADYFNQVKDSVVELDGLVHDDWVTCAAFGPDVVYTASRMGTIKRWRLNGEAIEPSLKMPSEGAVRAALATGQDDSKQICDLQHIKWEGRTWLLVTAHDATITMVPTDFKPLEVPKPALVEEDEGAEDDDDSDFDEDDLPDELLALQQERFRAMLSNRS